MIPRVKAAALAQLNRYLEEINFASFRFAAIEKIQNGLKTVEEVLRVIPKSPCATSP